MSPNVNPVELERALEGTTVPSAKRQVLVPSHGYPVGFLTLIALFLIKSDIMYLYTIFYYRSSVCLELKFLASSDNLWKLQFTYEFGCQTESIKVKAPGQWKNIFAREWCHQKRCLHHTKEVEQYLNNNCYNDRSGESTFPMLLRPQLSPL